MEDDMRIETVLARNPVALALVVAACVLLVSVAMPAPASAGEPQPLETDPGQCALCHQAEVHDWQSSPHAAATMAIESDVVACEEGQDCSCLTCHTTNFSPATGTFEHTGVTCEACHGPLVEGHPENGHMVLSVDSSVCSDCHEETFADWQTTSHADAGVQCIGCHRSHTQNLRLDDQALCRSCHRDDVQDGGHLVHMQSGLDCVTCHTSPASSPHVDAGPSGPTHQFEVATAVCAGCHSGAFHGEETTALISAMQPGMVIPAATGAEVASQTETATEQSVNSRTAQASAVSLGLGIGIGAMAGIIFMLAVGVIVQRPWRRKS
jgi:hypothetical protein